MDSGKQLGFSPAQKVYRPSPRQYLTFRVLNSLFPVVAGLQGIGENAGKDRVIISTRDAELVEVVK